MGQKTPHLAQGYINFLHAVSPDQKRLRRNIKKTQFDEIVGLIQRRNARYRIKCRKLSLKNRRTHRTITKLCDGLNLQNRQS